MKKLSAREREQEGFFYHSVLDDGFYFFVKNCFCEKQLCL